MSGPAERSHLVSLDVAGRADRLRAVLMADGLDGLLVTNLTNLRYLTGFTGSAARVMITDDSLTLVVDGRYGEQAHQQLAAAGVDADIRVGLTQTELQAHLQAAAPASARIGIEAAHVSIAEHKRFASVFHHQFVHTEQLIEGLRRTKDDGEVDRIEAAGAIASQALSDVFDLLEDEPTERAFQLALDRRMEDLGADCPSFETIVASGPNAALAHHHPDDRRIVEGDSLVLDFGATLDGYHSDMTRTLLIGDVDPWLAEAYGAVFAAQAAGVAAVRAGIAGIELDNVCRDHLVDVGFGAFYTHGTGHGVGLVIHETPWATPSSADDIRLGDVVTVEPGAYREGVGGIRIEDTVVVTADGCRPLTHTPKDLACLRSPRMI